jgi:hypothetical protein
MKNGPHQRDTLWWLAGLQQTPYLIRPAHKSGQIITLRILFISPTVEQENAAKDDRRTKQKRNNKIRTQDMQVNHLADRTLLPVANKRELERISVIDSFRLSVRPLLSLYTVTSWLAG